jgi:CRP/FNR family cyclic AMP-dependent transcriptional regulator
MLTQANHNGFQNEKDLEETFCIRTFFTGLDHHIEKTFKKGEFIYQANDPTDEIFFIMDGKVKVGAFSNTGKEITKAIHNEGDIFGEMALVENGNRRDFAQALEKSTICIIQKDSLKVLMRQNHELSMKLMRLMGTRMLDMERRLESLVFKDSRTRIIEFVFGLARRKGQRVGYETVIRNFGTHQEIANLTATSRQTVTTVLNDLRNRNILTFNRRRMLIRDMDMLEAEISRD